MSDRKSAVAAWIIFGLITISIVALGIYSWANRTGEMSPLDISGVFSPIIFALVGALIISRRPGNVIGLLLMLIAFSAIPSLIYGETLAAPTPAEPTWVYYGALWSSSWDWVPFVIAILFILVLFPTGKPFSPRWRWLIYLGLGWSLIFILLNTFGDKFVLESNRVVANPIGFLPVEQLGFLTIPIVGGLLLLAIGCPAALFVRYRRTGVVEREQIKWLFYAGVLFAVSFIVALLGDDYTSGSPIIIPFALSIPTIPVAIGIAILRYRLFDIDVIIRRTLQYGLLTITLVAMYFGIVLATQAAFVALTGQESPIAIVISTLVIAALFNPLRQRLQAFIDRRFYRQSYDAARTLQAFAQTARDEVQMDQLTAELTRVVQKTMQPETLSLWLLPDAASFPETGQQKGESD